VRQQEPKGHEADAVMRPVHAVEPTEVVLQSPQPGGQDEGHGQERHLHKPGHLPDGQNRPRPRATLSYWRLRPHHEPEPNRHELAPPHNEFAEASSGKHGSVLRNEARRATVSSDSSPDV